MVDISVVVPIYNGLQYLEKLISSLEESTFKNVEVLLIDDISTDGSYEFLQERIRNDSRFKLIRRELKGGSAVSAIKYILPRCKGEYFFYLSQDDFIDPDCLDKLFKKIRKHNADAAIPNMVWFKQEGSTDIIIPPNLDYDMVLSGRKTFELSIDWKIHGFSLRRMSLLREVGFDDSYFVGDEITTRIFYFNAHSVVFCDTNFYYRIDNENALTKKISPKFTNFILRDLILLDFIENNYGRNIIFINAYDDFLKKTYKLLRKIYNHFDDFTELEKKQFLEALLPLEERIVNLYKNNKRCFFYWFIVRFYLLKLKKY